MKKNFIIIFLLTLAANAYAGKIVTTSFYSESLQLDRKVCIYLPTGYDPNGSTQYPVIYYLHGAYQNHTTLINVLLPILNNLIKNNKIPPIILASPDGSNGPYAGSCFTNSQLYGRFEDYIAIDLIEFIDSNYKTIPVREKRCIMGLSMGGYGCLKLAFKHPDIYIGTASLCGISDFYSAHLSKGYIAEVLKQNPGPPYTYDPKNGTFTELMFMVAGACSPNLTNPPFQVDFPLDARGEIIPWVTAKWKPHNVLDLVDYLPLDAGLSIYFDCGTNDEWFVYPGNVALADKFDKLGIVHEFYSFVGGHVSQLNDRLKRAIVFQGSAMEKTTLVFDKNTLSNSTGGVVNFHLTASIENTNRSYIVLGSVSGTNPGTSLPGGNAILPLNWDAFTNMVIEYLNSSIFSNFLGNLDSTGYSMATLDTIGPFHGMTGMTLHFAYALNNPWDFVSNPVAIQIVP